MASEGYTYLITKCVICIFEASTDEDLRKFDLINLKLNLLGVANLNSLLENPKILVNSCMYRYFLCVQLKYKSSTY